VSRLWRWILESFISPLTFRLFFAIVQAAGKDQQSVVAAAGEPVGAASCFRDDLRGLTAELAEARRSGDQLGIE
jgi:hypothetical protein